MASKREKLEEILSDLADSLGSDMLGALIATPDGQVVASTMLKSNLSAEKLAAMSAAVVGTSERLSKIVEAGDFQDALVRCSNQNILSKKAGRRAILVCVIKSGANIGLLNIEVEDAIERITAVLGM
ncbi:Roadblock/LC7 family protein [Desulfurobacterium thermolithotrophum DSM 11699]|uniref:Roadblock/LC7 family protein n=1 Tax=Desulfurobacterium thermolithotrophum (strain DSM 11699 / BSA) TaxID=868864 RepID=F0S2B7_DESTD|nr:roadblock/LC7 domain-containing protein [Desulfurobacterium thermolithotrophum]ADY74132.1 Roadblock/LC7 family protein [Desulfurobacterium thermolithotrophum DSM 11699]